MVARISRIIRINTDLSCCSRGLLLCYLLCPFVLVKKKGRPAGRPYWFAQNAFYADGLKEVLTPHQREVNMRSRALLATARSEVRSSVNMEHSASELKLVGRVGNLSKSGKALKLDNSTD